MRKAKTVFDPRVLPATMRVPDAADLMQVTEAHLRKLLRAGDIAAKKIGKGWLIPTDNIVKHIGLRIPG